MKVYVRINAHNLITAVNCSAFISDLTGWVQIDEGEGDRYTHAQANYFSLPIKTDEGVLRYKLAEDDRAVERTPEEMAADEAETFVPPQATTEERVSELEAALDMLLAGVTE